MKAFLTSAVLLIAVTLAAGQRPFFAGSKPIGYPELATTEGLGDRFGEVDGTTQRLPLEANGDRDLIDRLSKLPIDKQPFWFINWQALEANRQKPQTYPQRPNPFIDTPPNSGTGSSNTGTSASNSGTSTSSTGTNLNAGTISNLGGSSISNANVNTENRFGTDVNKMQTTELIHGNFRPNYGSGTNSNSGTIANFASSNPSVSNSGNGFGTNDKKASDVIHGHFRPNNNGSGNRVGTSAGNFETDSGTNFNSGNGFGTNDNNEVIHGSFRPNYNGSGNKVGSR